LLHDVFFGGPFLFDFDTRYVNFAREWYAFDDRAKDANNNFIPETDTTRIGVYNQESDLIRTGQRLDMTPRLSLPFAIGPFVDVLPSVSYRESQYRFPLPGLDAAERRLLRSDVSLRTRFSRVYADSEDVKSNKYRHEIVPEVKHTSIPWSARSKHPFFGITDEESYFTSNTALTDQDDNKQFDYHDRLYEKNLFTFSLSNYLIRKKWNDQKAEYKQIALFRLQQSYDYNEAIKPSHPRQPWSDIAALLDVRLDWFETNTLVRYYPYQNLTTTFSRVRLMHPRRHSLELKYSQDYQFVKADRIYATARSEDLTAAATLYLKLIDLTGQSVYSWTTHKFSDYGYILSIRPPGDCWQIAFGQTWLPNDIRYALNVAFLFDGKNATNLSSK
jgi:LPS-assembly protein